MNENTNFQQKNKHPEPITTSVPVDIRETPQAYIIDADMPGLILDKLNIQLDHETLLIEGISEPQGLTPCLYKRQFRIIRGLNPDDVKAEYKDGTLTITIPKPTTMQPRKITVTTA